MRKLSKEVKADCRKYSVFIRRNMITTELRKNTKKND